MDGRIPIMSTHQQPPQNQQPINPMQNNSQPPLLQQPYYSPIFNNQPGTQIHPHQNPNMNVQQPLPTGYYQSNQWPNPADQQQHSLYTYYNNYPLQTLTTPTATFHATRTSIPQQPQQQSSSPNNYSSYNQQLQHPFLQQHISSLTSTTGTNSSQGMISSPTSAHKSNQYYQPQQGYSTNSNNVNTMQHQYAYQTPQGPPPVFQQHQGQPQPSFPQQNPQMPAPTPYQQLQQPPMYNTSIYQQAPSQLHQPMGPPPPQQHQIQSHVPQPQSGPIPQLQTPRVPPQNQSQVQPPPKKPTNFDLLTSLSLSDKDFPGETLEPTSASTPDDLKDMDLSKLHTIDPVQVKPVKDDGMKPKEKEEETLKDYIDKITDDSNESVSSDKAKASTKDIFTWDPTKLESFTAEVEKLELTVESFHKKSLSGVPTALDLKWREILDIQEANVASGRGRRYSISVARCYPMKNRFPDILPYDQTRVPLPSTKDDYINASFIKDLTPNSIPYIATQAPLPSCYSDFWTACWTYNIELIVCLSNDSDLKGHIYWPLDKTAPLEFGPLQIQLHAKNPLKNKDQPNANSGVIERIFYLNHRDVKKTRVLIHLQFTQWIVNVFPESPNQLLSFINETHSFYQQQRNLSHPVIIHCLAGVGRTGVFVLLSSALREINTGKGIPDLVKVAAKANEQRKGFLIDKEYLRFTYQCLLYFSQQLLMKHGILSTRTPSAFESEKKLRKHIRHPSQDFKYFFDTEVSKLNKSLLNQNQNGIASDSSEHQPHPSSSAGSEASGPKSPNKDSEESLTIEQFFPPSRDEETKTKTSSNPSIPFQSGTFGSASSSTSSFNNEGSSSVSLPNTPKKKAINQTSLQKNPEDTSPLDSLDPLWNFKK